MIKRLTDYTRRFAHHKHAGWWLFLYAIIESFAFPVPPDVLLVALALARPERAQRFALITAVGSVVGGLVGYGIGRFAFGPVAEPILNWACNYNTELCPAVFLPWLENLFSNHGIWVVAVSALSPIIPYKLTILVAGIAHMSVIPFTLMSFGVHWFRYSVVSMLVAKYGRQAMGFVEGRLQLIFTVAGAIALVIYAAVNYF